jgi:surface antigen
MPLPSLLNPNGNEDVTGSIRKMAVTDVDTILDGEDWRRAKAAMTTALDPQGNGAKVNWNNPETGARGAFTPVGGAYPSDIKICRAFLAEIDQKGIDTLVQGTACADKSGDWTIIDVKPWKKG